VYNPQINLLVSEERPAMWSWWNATREFNTVILREGSKDPVLW
jgi:hypothetical protein